MNEPRPLRLCLIAAEESGDQLGAQLMGQIVARANRPAEFVGLGGRAMAARGLASWFPIDDLGHIGVVAVLRHLPALLRRIREAADAVCAAAPDALVIIDSPDFTHRVARRVRARAPALPIIDYVSPSVWAWRPGRARTMRGYVDLVLALLPFEVEAHRRLGGPLCLYVGHPLLEKRAALRPDGPRPLTGPVLVLPGSRRSELHRHLPIYRETLARLAAERPDLAFVMPVPPRLGDLVRAEVASWPVPVAVIDSDEAKTQAFRTASAALAKSGTVTLELALAGIPMVTCYRVSEIEAFFARRLIHAPTAILANLVLGENAVPEFLQERCTADLLAPALRDILSDGAARARQVEAFRRLDALMETGAPPGALAAAAVLDQALRAKKGAASGA